MSLFRTVRQAEPFREMGKFLGMTVVAGGALYFVNEPVAAFLYTRQAAQEETRRRQEAAARAHQEALAEEREARVYMGPAMGASGGGDNMSRSSGGSSTRSNGSGSSHGVSGSPTTTSARLAARPSSLPIPTPAPAAPPRQAEAQQPRRLKTTRDSLAAAPRTPLRLQSFQHPQRSASLPSRASRAVRPSPSSTPSLIVADDPVIAGTVVAGTVDEGAMTVASDVMVESPKKKVYSWKSASRRMIQERRGVF